MGMQNVQKLEDGILNFTFSSDLRSNLFSLRYYTEAIQSQCLPHARSVDDLYHKILTAVQQAYNGSYITFSLTTHQIQIGRKQNALRCCHAHITFTLSDRESASNLTLPS